MRPGIRFAVALVLGLALVTWLASIVVRETTRDWFVRDTGMRAQLAVTGARQALISHWRDQDPSGLLGLLSEIAQDERIMGAAVCSSDGATRVHTAEYPAHFGCAELAARLRAPRDEERSPASPWKGIASVRGGDVHVSAIPLVDGEAALGFVVLVHDLSFVARREAETQRLLLAAFGILALAASAITIVAARLSWLGWSRELHASLRGAAQRPEFRPILRDVRELVDRIVSERESDGEGAAWTPQRLKHTLGHHLQGERVVIVANREPYIHEKGDDGEITVRHPASGLVTALEPVMRACSGVWIAHGSGSADRDMVDRHDRVRVPPGDESYVLRRVWLTPDEESGYYYGFANEGLWPLCHVAHARPVFRSDDWGHYQAVNRRFAEAVRTEVDSEDPIVLVQDYHFALAPRLIRERLPRATVIMFWHIPWPDAQRFGICPWRKELLDGMLGASILGFHTQLDCNNFVDSADRLLEARIDREQNAVVRRGRSTLIRPYPISLEWPNRWLRLAPPVDACRRSVFEELGLPSDARLGVGVDRLDYTKGIEERLLAIERLLERCPDLRGRFSFVELAAPSRTAIDRYRQLGESVEALVERINERYGSAGYRPLVLLRAHHEPPTVFRFLRAADVCYVSSLHYGMNLVAKEFVASREDERGVLVLSQFTGAARELTEALIVNPYDIEQASGALATALSMPPEEQRDRMRAMRAFISEFNVYRWAGRMLVDATRLRRHDRLAGRLGEPVTAIAAGR
jgi:trehalose 6-phosphate synthase